MGPIKIIILASVSLTFISTSLSCSLSKTPNQFTTPIDEGSSNELENTFVVNASKSPNVSSYKGVKLHNTHKKKVLRLRRRHVYKKHVFRNKTEKYHCQHPEKCNKRKKRYGRSEFQTLNDPLMILKRLPWTTKEPPVTTSNYDDYDSTISITDELDYIHRCSFKPAFKKEGRRVADIKCEATMWDIYNKIVCPFEFDDISGVVGGKNSVQGDFPHMGAVGWQKEPVTEEVYMFMCGSVLISNKFALTAGHCKAIPEDKRKTERLISVQPNVVQFGSVQIYERKSPGKCVHTKIERLIVHEGYKPPKLYNDLALIKFTGEIKMTKHIIPACIWIGDLGNREVGNVTGWGKTENGDRTLDLKFAEMTFIKSQECDDRVRVFRMRNWANGILENQFCAGDQPGVDTCLGDSGGPIQIRNPLPMSDSFMMSHVVGVTSFGVSKYCGENGKPGIFTNVTSFLCWIEKEVWPEEHNSFCD